MLKDEQNRSYIGGGDAIVLRLWSGISYLQYRQSYRLLPMFYTRTYEFITTSSSPVQQLLLITIVGLGYMCSQAFSTSMSMVAAWLSLYCTISNHPVIWSIIVEYLIMRQSSCKSQFLQPVSQKQNHPIYLCFNVHIALIYTVNVVW